MNIEIAKDEASLGVIEALEIKSMVSKAQALTKFAVKAGNNPSLDKVASSLVDSEIATVRGQIQTFMQNTTGVNATTLANLCLLFYCFPAALPSVLAFLAPYLGIGAVMALLLATLKIVAYFFGIARLNALIKFKAMLDG